MITQIDVTQIRSTDTQQLSSTFLTAIKKFYSDPRNLKDFEDWKEKNKDKQQK